MIQKDLLFARGGTFQKYKKNECIFFEGDTPVFYFQVVEGSVRIVNVNEDGREFIQDIFKEDQGFSIPALFIDAPYPVTAIANEPTTLIRIKKRNLLRIIQENTGIHLFFTYLLAEKLHLKTTLTKEIASEQPDHCIAAILKMLKKRNALKSDERYRVELSRQQLANMCGFRVETVIRTIKKLEANGIVTIEKGKVYVK